MSRADAPWTRAGIFSFDDEEARLWVESALDAASSLPSPRSMSLARSWCLHFLEIAPQLVERADSIMLRDSLSTATREEVVRWRSKSVLASVRQVSLLCDRIEGGRPGPSVVELAQEVVRLLPTIPRKYLGEERLRDSDLSFSIPRWESVRLRGVEVMLGHVPGRKLDLGAVPEALAEYKRTVSDIAPWLLRRGAPIDIANYTAGLEVGAGYYVRTGRVRIYLPRRISDDPRWIVKSIAHEQGHHIWRTSLSVDEKSLWQAATTDLRTNLDYRSVSALWLKHAEAATLRELAIVTRKELAETDGRLAIQLELASRGRHGSIEREDFLRDGWILVTKISVPQNPVTPYGDVSSEESFCEAIAMWVAFGPGAVDEEHRERLRRFTPGIRPNPSRPVPSRARGGF